MIVSILFKANRACKFYEGKFFGSPNQDIIENCLGRMHEKEIVHSDVRLANMVFLQDGSGKLIDFDLADKVGTGYPVNYNYEFDERHPTAKSSQPRKKS